ncbi:MAG: YibE/F family protein [Bacillota bacterium]|nr:YibE/F family protein [Bacillota bacterium]HOC06456.1 YibE/F family protein [Bacillota bacterium]HPZ22718.1 YibE/F family protein [Bacillota bacterium]
MKKASLLALLLVGTLLLGAASAYSSQENNEDRVDEHPSVIVRAKVLAVSPYEEIKDDWYYNGKQQVVVEVMRGRFQGQTYEIDNYFTGISYQDMPIKEGDQVLLLMELDGSRVLSVQLYEYGRDRYLYILLGLFVAVTILIAGTKGLKALLALLFAGAVVMLGMLPLILQGRNPYIVTLLASALIAVFSLVLYGGFTARSLAAIAGTLGGEVGAVLTAFLFGHATRLTGFNADVEMLFSWGMPTNLDLRGLLIAGFIICSLGAVIDLSQSISASVFDFRRSNPLLTFKGLFIAGFRSGKDKLARTLTVIMLAFAGVAMPLLLLFAAREMSYLNIANLDMIATETVRAMASGFGLLAAAPVAAAAAAFLASKGLDSKKTGRV